VITEDNLVVEIDTVLYFQVTDPRSAAYEIASYLQAVEQLTVTTLRNVVGSMDLEQTLTSRDEINSRLREVLDEATGKWGLRVNRVEIKAVDPPKSIKDAMEKQMRAERDKRASILTAEGARASQILTAEGDKQGAILRAEGERAAAILRECGPGPRIDQVFTAAPQRPRPGAGLPVPADAAGARSGPGNTPWVILSEMTSALSGIAYVRPWFRARLADGQAAKHGAGPTLPELDGPELNGSGSEHSRVGIAAGRVASACGCERVGGG
jgi:hypothetical protein